MTYNSILSQILIRPKNAATDLGVFRVKGYLSDSHLTSEFSFTLEVFNNPPSMKGYLEDQSVFYEMPSSYTIPVIEDEEGLYIREEPERPLPSFVTYEASSRTFMFKPTELAELGSHIINYCFKDDFSSQTCKSFKVTVLDPA